MEHGRTVIIGAGPAGLTAGLRARHGSAATPSSTRPTTWSAASRAAWSSRATASTSAAIASSPRCREIEALWHEILGDDLLVPRAALAHLLPRALLRLPAQAGQRAPRPRPARVGPRARQLRALAALPDRGRTHLRRLGHQPLRPPAVRDLLQDLHREGLGHAVLRDQRGVGGAAHQEPRPEDGGEERGARPGHPRRRRRHEPHRAVPLPAPRPGHDVGAVPGHRRRARDRDAPADARGARPPRWRPRDRGRGHGGRRESPAGKRATP